MYTLSVNKRRKDINLFEIEVDGGNDKAIKKMAKKLYAQLCKQFKKEDVTMHWRKYKCKSNHKEGCK